MPFPRFNSSALLSYFYIIYLKSSSKLKFKEWPFLYCLLEDLQR
jgi:hypothetical protein